MIGLLSYQTWDSLVPPTLRTVRAMVIPKVKVENFLYILHFSGPHRVQRHQCYTTCWNLSCCKKATVPYLPISPYISQGGKNQPPANVNFGPRHISAAIRARKLKFYVHIDRAKYSLRA